MVRSASNTSASGFHMPVHHAHSVTVFGVRCSVLGAQVRAPFPILSAAYALKLTGCFKFNAFETTIFFYKIIGSFSTTWIFTEHTTPTYIFTKPLTFCHILSSSSESLCSWTLPRLCYFSFIVIFFHFSFCSDMCWMYITDRFHWHCFGTSRISYYIFFRASPPFFVLQLSFFIFPTLRTWTWRYVVNLLSTYYVHFTNLLSIVPTTRH